jgi:hypothetical protein
VAPVRGTPLWLRVDTDLQVELNADMGAADQARFGLHGRWKAIPEEPVEVEWLPGWSLRVPGNPDPVRLPDRTWWLPTLDGAIGLFVKRPVALHIDALDGPIFGKVLPGAFLPVYEPGPRVTEVVLFDYWGMEPVHGNTELTSLHAFVESDALAVRPLDGPIELAESADYLDWHLPLAMSPDGDAFTNTVCGVIHVMARDGSKLQVSQYRHGIWVTGWTHVPNWRRGSDYCLPRVVRLPSSDPSRPRAPPRVPRDYVTVTDDPAIQDPLGSLMSRGGALYVVRGWADDALRCVEWLVKPAGGLEKVGPDRFGRVSELRPQGKDDRLTRHLTYAERQGPVLAQVIVSPADCPARYAIVAASRDHISLVNGMYPRGIAAYHPDDREDWYFTQAACKAAAVRMSGSEPGLGRVFSEGC